MIHSSLQPKLQQTYTSLHSTHAWLGQNARAAKQEEHRGAAKTRNKEEIVLVDADGVEDIEEVRAHDDDVSVSEDDPAW